MLGRQADGTLALLERLPTSGFGTGASLGSQGAVTVTGDGRRVLVVNAASHTLSLFTLVGERPSLESVVDSGGLMPVSVAESNGLVYVLNAVVRATSRASGSRPRGCSRSPAARGLCRLRAAPGRRRWASAATAAPWSSPRRRPTG